MLKLLIIEDEWMMAHMIKEVATLVSLEVIGVATSWSEASQLLRNNRPDFAIVDININGSVHGLEVAKYLKEMGIDFLFLTAYKDLTTIQQATNLSPLSYLIKPITPETIMATFILIKTKLQEKNPCKESHKYIVDANNMTYADGILLDLSKSEHAILSALVKNIGFAVTYETFFYTLPYEFQSNNETLRNSISKLRKRCPDLEIKNIKDVGYIASLNY